MKKLIIPALLLIPLFALANPVSVNRLNGNHIEPLVNTDFIQAKNFVGTSTSVSNSFASKVGIGTTTPTDALDISGNEPCVRMYDADNPWDSHICNQFQNISWEAGGDTFLDYSGSLLLRSTNNGQVALISNGGGIGAGAAILESNGDFVVGPIGTGQPFIFKAANRYIGIATSSPSFPLSLEGALYQHGSYSHFGTAESPTPCNTFGAQCMEFIGDDNTTGGVGIQVQNINGGTSAYTYLNLLNNRFATNLSNFSGFFLNSGGYSDPTFGTANNVPDILMTENTMGNLGFIASSTAVGTNGQIQFYNQGANAVTNLSMLIDRTGNVGIGVTTSPGTALSIGSTGANTINISPTATSTFGSGINVKTGCFAVNGTCVGSGSGSGTVNTGNIGQVPYYAAVGTTLSPTSTLVVDVSSNVGVGSTTPGAKLTVTNPNSSVAASFVVEDQTSPDLTPFIIDNLGNVGVGTSTNNTGGNVLNNNTLNHKLNIYSTGNADIGFTNNGGSPNVGWTVGSSKTAGDFYISQSKVANSNNFLQLNSDGSGTIGSSTTSMNFGNAQLQGPSGFVETPGYSFFNNPSIGMWLDSSSQMNFESLGQLVNFNGGNMNINPTNMGIPALRLYDASNSGNGVRFNLQTQASGISLNDGFSFIFAHPNTYLVNYENGPIQFWTNNSFKMLVDQFGNFGIGTTTPSATSTIQSNSNVGDAFVMATSTGNTIGGEDNDGHRFTSGPSGAISICGTGSPTIVGDDQGGIITTGTAATACTYTFAKAYRAIPYCIASDDSGTITPSVTTTTTNVVFGLGAGLSGGKIQFNCAYHR